MTRVYRDYDQAALDRAYTQSVWAPSAEAIISWYGIASAAARARLPHMADVAYGASAAECLDFFPAQARGAPIVVYIHGGAWKDLTKAESAFAAETFVASGICFAAIDFATIPSVRLPEMIAQVQRAVAWLHRHATQLGADPDNIHLVGHSSGAHLVAAALACGWPELGGGQCEIVRSAFCASGSYDLEPVMLSYRGRYLQLDEAEARALSPIHHVEQLTLPLTLAFGGRESPEFQRQAQAFGTALERVGRLEALLCDDQEDHFTISATLAQPDGFLARAILERVAS